MSSWTRKTRHVRGPVYKGQHRFEHWYRDNQVYFLTARCWDRFPAFASEEAKAVFWDRFNFYTREALFTPWVTSIVNNHYHSLGYCKAGDKLGIMMQRIHGSVAKLVNDLLPERRKPFWGNPGCENYFDGCIRDERAVPFGLSLYSNAERSTRPVPRLARVPPHARQRRLGGRHS
ncbi:MAG: hypothetical protein KKE86_02900 [Planctomycetes bacterium]|nr:hypothetical protein [Planctomycetota bacterium]MBU4398264.1 hypothetical protein [Planctomycetota bacterium]MCG2683960.1 hypothetical protein [Planctomycetales bacterium]